MTTYQRRVLLSTSAEIALENMDITFLALSLSSMITSFRISGTQTGFISTITNLGILIGGTFFGIIADKYGRVKVFSQMALLSSIASLLMYFVSNIYLAYLFRFIAGIGVGGKYRTCMSLISESFSKKQIGRVSSVAGTGAQVGVASAAILAAVTVPTFGWKMLYIVDVLPVLMVLFIRRGLTEPEELKFVQSAEKKTRLSRLFESKHLAWQICGLSIMVIVQVAGYFELMNWLPSIMQNRLGLSVSGSSLWMVGTTLGMSLGMMTLGAITDKLGPKLASSLFLICSSLSIYLLVLAHSQWSLVAVAVIVGCFINGMYGGYDAVISSLYPTEIHAVVNNFTMNLGRAVGGFSSVVIGFLMDHYSLTAIILFLSGIYLVSLLILITLTGVTALRENLQH